MSELIKHECGIALIRLLKPLQFYQKKYGTWQYGLQKLYLLLEKQHNRGQDGAGVACLKLNHVPGLKYLNISRSNKPQPIQVVFDKIRKSFRRFSSENEKFNDSVWAKKHLPFAGELYMGHLRYGTFGNNSTGLVHPVLRENNWKTRNLMLAGNFNLTNVDEIFEMLLNLGQHPKNYTDTVTILENIGHFLDEENQKIFDKVHQKAYSNREITAVIEEKLNITKILKKSSKKWDGGYVISGIIGHGDAFVMRDPNGIRPAFYYHDNEIAVVASERPVIQTVFNIQSDKISEIAPGYAFIVKKDGTVTHERINKSEQHYPCSFERIYFSRGSDKDIYEERKKLGELLSPAILTAINCDLGNSIFSFIPNTAEPAFYGMIGGVRKALIAEKKQKIAALNNEWTEEALDEIISKEPRIEKIAWKDAKLRTFITADDDGRNDLIEHIYDVTYGKVKKKDTLIVVDDSIVRGNTLKKSILRILNRLNPKKIIIVSSAPQIRFPDCYGIDMSRMDEFIAFHAAIALLKEKNMAHIIKEVYENCKKEMKLPKSEMQNRVKKIYEPFSDEEISRKISELLTDKDIKAEVEIIYQTIENLHVACPNHKGDWYFSGNYPTPGGNKVVNRAFINYVESKAGRSYQLSFFS